MHEIQVYLNTGFYKGILLDNPSSDNDILMSFIDSIVVPDFHRKNDMLACTCVSTLFSGPTFTVDVPIFVLIQHNVRVNDIEQLSEYVKSYIRDNGHLSIDTDYNNNWSC